ncbi:pyridoxal phosphate-dependent transferase [Armillaria novae-zelandiae]|uniref:alanine--glyoxylate transaminase n=1 Tax=Armillaria novae-zelandiae TaxID=153914 RepID=A0AA39PRU8_9AGAR|nr:pyridoxal phosphate-dependent transferase [Armillaria novae-zelandiae]
MPESKIQQDIGVLDAISQPPMSHVSPGFVKIFRECMDMTSREVSSNLVEPGEPALVVNTGYFGDGFSDCLQAYGANVDHVRAPLGDVVPSIDIERALKKRKYKIISFTAFTECVLSDVKAVAKIARNVSPETLVIVDGVCSVASEEVRMDDWDIDVILTASQKGLGTPPGLSILVASARAIKVFENRKVPVASYYASWQKWLPIMRAYDSGSPAYFATPPVNMVYAYHASLKQITVRLEDRFRAHQRASERIKAVARQLGYTQIPQRPSIAANGMTAIYVPDGFAPKEIIPRLTEHGIVVAGGLHKEVKDKYIRIGHMGTSVVDERRGDIETIEKALKASVRK